MKNRKRVDYYMGMVKMHGIRKVIELLVGMIDEADEDRKT